MRFLFLLQVAGLMLWRSWRATAVLAFMVISAVAALVFLSALAVGTNDAMIRNSTGLFSGHITGHGLEQAGPELLRAPGVRQVLIRRQQQVLLAATGGLEPVVLIGVDPTQEKAATAYWKKTVRGAFPNDGEASLFLSQDTGRRLKVDINDTVNIVDRQGKVLKALTVGGLYRTGISQLDQGVAFCPAGALPEGHADLSAAVFLQPEAEVTTIAAHYQQQLPAATFTTWMEFMPDLNQLIDLDHICMAIVIFLVFAIVSVGISCAFLIFTLKNLREHGIMKAMGLFSSDTALLLVSQIGLLTSISAAIGTLAGTLLVAVFATTGIDIGAFTSHNQYFAVSGILTPRLTGPALLAPPVMAVIFGFVAAIWPIASIIRQNPAEILRSI